MKPTPRAGQRICLLVFDFDHTALGGHVPYDQFPRPFARFLDELDASGIRWATDTTWGPESQHALIKRSGVKSRPVFLSGATGRMLATIKRGKMVSDEAHSREIARRDKRFRAMVGPLLRAAMLKLLARDLVTELSFNSCNQNIVTFAARPGCARQAWAILRPLVEGGQFYCPWNMGRLSANTLLPHFMNKADVVRKMQRRLGIGPAHTIVAGDSTNDRHLFDPAIARHMVCPANATPLIKKLARKHGGVVATKKFSWGVIEGVKQILRRDAALADVR